ncbi:MAG TPA: tetratricopeptide repeat protein [Acidobacteriota bacterium]|jgi:tetratricopeptide (TPR) repeat protein|nr:tetratricopeptide repeat protein [Acidobacteriota bacterium]HNR39397.1 tetratricopeptide repeat protein [Acidobacteriota bacterium]HNU00222.1 tetratricopeptide repeat protein [Acidobacteriota bacterium]HQO26779.1 tetratricopeptide repeat protein [Acidobacteriota bacterium]HQP74812.1 tetratricopeptide repeat protein [Acidobacteriota bacterium]
MRTEAINGVVRFLSEHLTFIVLVIATAFVTSCILLVLNQKDAEDLFRLAQEQIGTNQPRAAADTLRAIEREYPHWKRMAEVYYLQGNILYFHENNLYGAMDFWQRALAADPASPHDFEIHRRLAEIHLNVIGDLSRAEAELKYLIARHPAHADIPLLRLELARCYVKTERPEVAIIELKNLIGTVTDAHTRQQAVIQLAMIYYNQKNYQRAREFLEPVTREPHCDDCRYLALMVMSDILEIQEDYDKAIEILGQIPDNILSEEKKQARISSIKKQFVPSAPSGGRTR